MCFEAVVMLEHLIIECEPCPEQIVLLNPSVVGLADGVFSLEASRHLNVLIPIEINTPLEEVDFSA